VVLANGNMAGVKMSQLMAGSLMSSWRGWAMTWQSNGGHEVVTVGLVGHGT